MPRLGVLILCGGESSRMGRSKADLPFGDETLLQRIERSLRAFSNKVAVVAAKDQQLPPLPPSVTIVRDERSKLGPLEGLRVGLSTLENDVDLVLATGCDLPFLTPAFGHSLVKILEEDSDIAATTVEDRVSPLPALIRPRVHRTIASMLGSNQRRVSALFQEVQATLVGQDSMVDLLPHDLLNVNRP
ncbi:MAG: molybdenum cofactor guanylyltransferase, partial [bacterium]|nr:molybdenum cofactor guanylyltransferase [bacterium]